MHLPGICDRVNCGSSEPEGCWCSEPFYLEDGAPDIEGAIRDEAESRRLDETAGGGL